MMHQLDLDFEGVCLLWACVEDFLLRNKAVGAPDWPKMNKIKEDLEKIIDKHEDDEEFEEDLKPGD